MTLNNHTRLLVGATALVGVLSIAATTDAAQVDVSASVPFSCEVDANATIAFGEYDVVNGNTSDDQFLVSCSGQASVTVTLDKGIHGSSQTGRKMKNGTSTQLLSYNLKDDTNANFTDFVTPVDLGAPAIVNVFGSIDPNFSDLPAGSFADTVQITLSF